MKGLLRRLRAVAKRPGSSGVFRTDAPRPLDMMSDAELEEELIRRRRARAARPKRGTDVGATTLETIREKQLTQHYASLELPVGASAEDVKNAYRRLMRRYHPDRHATDPERFRAATELAESLTRAYEALLKDSALR